MEVFVVTHNKRVRAVFATEKAAREYVGIDYNVKPTVRCECCDQEKRNPEYHPPEEWKKNLEIKAWKVEGEPA